MTDTFSTEEVSLYRCHVCGFELWNPICRLKTGFVGLYDDGRFPGRCLFVALDHFEDLRDLPPGLLGEFAWEATKVAGAIVDVTGAPRINYAVLGNTEAHVHFHLIPRYSEAELLPERSPWDDPRPKTLLPTAEKAKLVAELRRVLEPLSNRSPRTTEKILPGARNGPGAIQQKDHPAAAPTTGAGPNGDSRRH